MRARSTVVLLVLALAAYFVLIGYRGSYLIGQHHVELKVLGLAVLVLPLVGAWVVVAEVRFGLATARLASRLDAEDVTPEVELPRLPSGRVDRRAADGLFAQRKAQVEADPDDWRRWYELARAYDLAGDRRRARSAMRTAIAKSDSTP